jgi:hypothetical protein
MRWDSEKCLHSAKCMKNIPQIIEKPGVYSIPITDKQFEVLLSQSRFCPGGALKIEG